MSRTTKTTQQIRSFLLNAIPDHPGDIVAMACKKYDRSRQSINRHIIALIEDGLVTAEGKTRKRIYRLALISSQSFEAPLQGLQEDALLQRTVAPLLADLPENVRRIWEYGFTEMVNNAIDHSEGTKVNIKVDITAISKDMMIYDDGVGIFRKIQRKLGLEDERHAVLELSKGKLTTDPINHSGQGIFFTSRMFDDFNILSGGIVFSHQDHDESDWIFDRKCPAQGTLVSMSLRNNTRRTAKMVFDKYSSTDGDYDFTKTVVPVRLLRHGPELVVSRSQAKRLLAGVNRFKIVVLDFTGIDTIGQAFADEIFRVFVKRHPAIEIIPINMRAEVKKMVTRAQSAATSS